MTSLHFRRATISDAPALAALALEARATVGDGQTHPAPGTIQPGMAAEIARHLGACLSEGFEGVIFCEGAALVGFALFRRYPDHVHLTRFVVAAAHRSNGTGVAAFEWLWANEWADSPMIKREVGHQC